MYGMNENMPHPPPGHEGMESCLNISGQQEINESTDKTG